jgi:hypothetical protein
MARNLAGAVFNYTPDQLQKVFGPGGLTVDTTDRFGLDSLGVPSTKSNRSLDALTQLKQSGIDPNSFSGLMFMKQFGAPTQAEEFKNTVPLLKEISTFQADLANKNAERKFAQELLGAGIGALGRGITTSVAGGSPAILGALAQAPLTGAKMFQEGLQIPFTPAQPMSPRQYQSQRYFS